MFASAAHKKWTGEEVLRMVEAGILAEDAPYELIEGELVEMSPQGPLHTWLIQKLRKRLEGVYRGVGYVREEKPIVLGEFGLPEPDVAVAGGDEDVYIHRHPRGDEVILAVEIAITSGAADRSKAGPYARGGVPVYWILDVRERRLLVHSDPRATGYGLVSILDEEQDIHPPGRSEAWKVRDLLP